MSDQRVLGQTVYLTWELERAWSPADLDALAVALPGEPCVQEPTDEAGRIAIISMDFDEVDETAAARAALAAVRGVLRPRRLGGRVVEAIIYTDDASWNADVEVLESWSSST